MPVSKFVDFYFDYQSPYAYFASERIEAICDEHSAGLRWCPFVIGAAFQAHQITPSGLHEIKKRHMLKDLQTLSNFHGIPYSNRTDFIFRSVSALRVTLAADPALHSTLVHALFRAIFVHDKDLGDKDTLKQTLDDAGLDGSALLIAAEQESVKASLREQTDAVIAKEIFGAPTFLVTTGEQIQWYWGQDRLPMVEQQLQTGMPV